MEKKNAIITTHPAQSALFLLVSNFLGFWRTYLVHSELKRCAKKKINAVHNLSNDSDDDGVDNKQKSS